MVNGFNSMHSLKRKTKKRKTVKIFVYIQVCNRELKKHMCPQHLQPFRNYTGSRFGITRSFSGPLDLPILSLEPTGESRKPQLLEAARLITSPLSEHVKALH